MRSPYPNGLTHVDSFFSALKSSCFNWKLSGSPTGSYLIDPDGSGGLPYIPVRCDMAPSTPTANVHHDRESPLYVTQGRLVFIHVQELKSNILKYFYISNVDIGLAPILLFHSLMSFFPLFWYIVVPHVKAHRYLSKDIVIHLAMYLMC